MRGNLGPTTQILNKRYRDNDDQTDTRNQSRSAPLFKLSAATDNHYHMLASHALTNNDLILRCNTSNSQRSMRTKTWATTRERPQYVLQDLPLTTTLSYKNSLAGRKST